MNLINDFDETQSAVGIVSHDAGGAEVLSSYVAQHELRCKFVLEGPALKIFERKLGSVPITSLADAISHCDSLLCGTSWQSDLEWRAIGLAKAVGKCTTAFLDHWGNYRERFVRQGVQNLPDTIWVGDKAAEGLARSTFPETAIQLVPNPYFEDIRVALSKLEHTVQPEVKLGLRVLFVCEPVSEHALKEHGDERHWGYTEFDALHYFFANRDVLGKPLAALVIRPHPSEEKGKYDKISNEFGGVASAGGGQTLLQEIVESDVVVGCASMAMVIALIVGRRVICAIPPGGHTCGLPQPEIESLQILQRNASSSIDKNAS
jgi:hypothetical protein